MPKPVEERRPPITPQLAVRVAVLGGLAFVLFAIVFFRLWFLQVLSGEDYVSQARDNRVRKVRIEAPRGNIVDRHGTVLVKTRVAPVVQIVPSSLPESVLEQSDEFRKERGEAEQARLAANDRLRSLERDIRERRGGATRKQRRERRQLAREARQAAPVAVPPVPLAELELRRLYRRLGRVIDVQPKTIHERVIEGVAELPYSNVTIRTAVDRDAFNYIRERKEEFPGVAVEKQYLRDYPHEELGAQLFGTTREISPEELKQERFRGVEPGTRIGADGIEEAYDKYLRGTDGFTRVVINALGSRDDRRRMTRREPRQGQRLRLTLDLKLQRAANDAIARGVAAASQNGAKAGAFVAMDPRNGEILALGSYPSFDANEFAKPISQARYNQLSSEELGAPLFNRAIAATYPTGSTFKPITAMAALEEGVITPETPIVDDGEFELGDRVFKNAKDAVFGTLTLPGAMTVSSDVFFYTLGADMNGRGPVLQEWARRLGVGRQDRDRHPRRVRRPGARLRVAQRRLQGVPALRQEGQGDAGDDRGAVRVRRHRARVVGGRQRQPRRRPGRPAGDAAPDGHRVLDDHQQRQGRAAAPRHAGRGRQRRDAGGDPRRRRGAASRSTRATATRSWPACTAPPPPTAARRATSSRTSRTATCCTARRAPPSARRTRTSPGTSAMWTTRRSRSWSSPRSSAEGLARRLRHPQRASSSMSGSI